MPPNGRRGSEATKALQTLPHFSRVAASCAARSTLGDDAEPSDWNRCNFDRFFLPTEMMRRRAKVSRKAAIPLTTPASTVADRTQPCRRHLAPEKALGPASTC